MLLSQLEQALMTLLSSPLCPAIEAKSSRTPMAAVNPRTLHAGLRVSTTRLAERSNSGAALSFPDVLTA